MSNRWFKLPLKIPVLTIGVYPITFSPPLSFAVKFYKDKNRFTVDDDFLSIHEAENSFEELAKAVKEDLVFQWKTIAMQSDNVLATDALRVKKYFIARALGGRKKFVMGKPDYSKHD